VFTSARINPDLNHIRGWNVLLSAAIAQAQPPSTIVLALLLTQLQNSQATKAKAL
jgi:hypothetical protein